MTDTQNAIVNILSSMGRAGMPGHVPMRRLRITHSVLSKETRNLNMAFGEPTVIWTRLNRDGTKRRAGQEALSGWCVWAQLWVLGSEV